MSGVLAPEALRAAPESGEARERMRHDRPARHRGLGRSSDVERFADTPSTGGTAIDESGAIHLIDVDHNRIVTISPEGKITTPFADPRLIWVDAMWIDDRGDLLLPAAQLNRTVALNGGQDTVEQPITLYRYPIGRIGVRSSTGSTRGRTLVSDCPSA